MEPALLALALLATCSSCALANDWPQYETNPFRFTLAQPGPGESDEGGIICADANGDGRPDFIYTTPGSVGAYAHDGSPLWVSECDVRVSGSSERFGLPGIHHPNVQVGDVDGDGRAEVVFLLQDGRIRVLDGPTGAERAVVAPATPAGVTAWQHLVVCNLRGEGDRDLVLQAPSDADDYKVGNHVAGFSFDGLEPSLLWQRDDFGALAHGPLRVADLNSDGRDEICGFTILGPNGSVPANWAYPPMSDDIAGGASFHIDSLFVADVRPDVPGLEVVLLEEGRNYLALVNYEAGVLWHVTNDREEPQNAAVGDFDPARPGLEIWCRSRRDEHQVPWVVDAMGEVISGYAMDDVAPPDWTTKGVEVIWAIDWTGEQRQLACAKARHEQGDVCVFDPMSGEFLQRFTERAARLYVADIAGDWREEIVVVTPDGQVHVYHNPASNPRPNEPRLWERQHYRRAKSSWNYYSP